MKTLMLILASVFGLLVVFHFATKRRRPGRALRRGADPLVTACLGDRHKAARLLDYERRRAPGISIAEAQRRALDRLTDDRSR